VLRSAVSIGRRLQDPLSELVKINPANIGVGLYQHDVKSKHLEESLDGVVESCVNFVGVDVNTASPALLRYVSGLNQLTARRMYEYRQKHGPFRNRGQFRNVPGFGEAAFVQAAGFLKIMGGYSDGSTDIGGYSLGIVAPVAGFNIGAMYAKNSDTDAQGYELFINKEVFKNTYFYAEYGSVDETTATSIKGDGFAIGMIFTF